MMDFESEQHPVSPSKASGDRSRCPVMPDGMQGQVLRDPAGADDLVAPHATVGGDVQHSVEPVEPHEATAAGKDDKDSSTSTSPTSTFDSAKAAYLSSQDTQSAPAMPADNRNSSEHVRNMPNSTGDVHAGERKINGNRHAHGDKKQNRTVFRSAFCGVFGGCLGSAVIFAALYFGGFFNKPIRGYNHNIPSVTIKSDDANVPVAKAVANKVLPSVTGIRVAGGVGSGVVLDTEGHILTNYHVVADAELIDILIGDKSYEASVVGNDPSSDLSVLKVDLKGDKVAPIEFADSSAVEVGDWVMSVGSPFGNDQSVSSGIVSALYRSTVIRPPGRSPRESSIYTNMIQTDAAVNPGNSGGALVNDRGQLIGIIASKSGEGAGVGFAIPSNYADKIAKQLIARKMAVHAYMGAKLTTPNAFIARREGHLIKQGARIASVAENSPASKAGLQKGDIITKFDNKPITSADALILAVRSREIGDTVTIEYTRGSERISAQLVLGSDEALQISQHDALVNQDAAPEGPTDLFERFFQRNGSRSKNTSNT